jgi:heme oxygenase (biliverdin-IX-beta and delta-forming)
MSIMHELREATRIDHLALETSLGLTSEDVSTSKYVQAIETFYGYYDPIEKRIPDISGVKEVIHDLPLRMKVPLLKRDLLYWGSNERILPRCSALPHLDDALDALGCLYVLEGATLGGRLLTRYFQARLGILPNAGGAFFAGYGERTGTMWHAFGNALGSLPLSSDQSEQVVRNARSTFRTLHRWCTENHL